MNRLLSFFNNKRNLMFKAFLFVVTLIIIVFFFPETGRFKYEYIKGNPWLQETLYSPMDFQIVKSDEEIKKEKKELTKRHIPLFIKDETIYHNQKKKILERLDIISTQIIENKINHTFGKKDIDSITNDSTPIPSSYDSKQDYIDEMKRLKKEQEKLLKSKLLIIQESIVQNLKKIYDEGKVDLKQYNQLPYDDYLEEDDCRIKIGNSTINPYVIRFSNLDVKKDIETNIFTKEEIELLFNIKELKSIKPNIIYNKKDDEKKLRKKFNSISKYNGTVKKGEIIISKGDRINDDKFQTLFSFQKEYEHQNWSESSSNIITFGQTLLVFISLLVLYLFLLQYRQEVLKDNSKISLVLLLIILMILGASFTVKLHVEYLYLFPFCISPIILKAFFDTRIAFFVHLITILIIGFIVPNSFEFIYLQIIAGIISIISVLKMYKRSQLFISSLKIISIYFLAYFSLSIIHGGSFEELKPENFGFFTINGILTLLAYPLIFGFEKTFSLVSDVSLLELTDSNSPLLRRLAEEAPGTFQHSLQVATLTEQAAIQINANAILARAGALYHDIGKLNSPEYFIENQKGSNPHDKIKFDESAKIIIDHVSEGIDLAKKNKLPNELVDFIKTHHGTSTVQYFYKQFVASYPEKDGEIEKFTYPGPKPFSKETAILMMADSVEAAARTLKKPDTENINSLVNNIIDYQLANNQFTEADITLKEISEIKRLFKKKLENIYHARIEY